MDKEKEKTLAKGGAGQEEGAKGEERELDPEITAGESGQLGG